MRGRDEADDMPETSIEHAPRPVGSRSPLRAAAVVALALVGVVGFAVQGRVAADRATPPDPRAAVPPAATDPAQATPDGGSRDAEDAAGDTTDEQRRDGDARRSGPTARPGFGPRPPRFWTVVTRGDRRGLPRPLSMHRDGSFESFVPLNPEVSPTVLVQVMWGRAVEPDAWVRVASSRIAIGTLVHRDIPVEVGRGSVVLGRATSSWGAHLRAHPAGRSYWHYELQVQGDAPWSLQLRIRVSPDRPTASGGAPDPGGRAPREGARADLPRFWLSARGGAELGTIRVLEPRGRGLAATVDVPRRALRHPEARLMWSPDGSRSGTPLITVALRKDTRRMTYELASGTVSLRGGAWVDDRAPSVTDTPAGLTLRLSYRLHSSTSDSAISVRAFVEPAWDPKARAVPTVASRARAFR